MKGKFTVLNVRDLLHSLKVHGPACPCRGHTRTHIHIPKSSSIQKFVPSSTTNVIKIPSRHKTFSTIPPVNSKSILFNDVGDYAFEMATSSIRFGPGVTREVGFDLKDLGAKNVCVIADPNLAKVKDSPVQVVIESIEKQKLKYSLFTDVKVEPTDSSFKAAINFATGKNFDAFVAVGGGSTMDTAKAANLYSTYPPADFLDYVNPPIGKGLQPPGPVKPLICIPTTAGTGSEATGVAIFDLESIHAKTGIASRRIKPTLGIVDPLNTRYLAPEVAACSGFDVLCHSLESYTAIPFYKRTPRPNSPSERLTYQGSNPIADVWSLRSLEMVSKWLPIAVEDPSNDEARSQVLLAATFAGIGFGNAGVHLCHGMSYPVAGMVKNYVPPGYNSKKPMVPHGMSVVLNAPSVFTFTSPADPKRHLKCAEIMGADISKAKDEDAGMILADQIRKIMKRLKMPNGLKAVGYTKQDIPQLVKGTLPQHRVTKLSPRPVGEIELTHLFENAMEVY